MLNVALCLIKFVLLGLTIFGLFEPDKNQPLMMSNQESWHLVDECVISPLHSSLEVTPEDLVSRVSQVDSGHSRALSSSTNSSSSSKRGIDTFLFIFMTRTQEWVCSSNCEPDCFNAVQVSIQSSNKK